MRHSLWSEHLHHLTWSSKASYSIRHLIHPIRHLCYRRKRKADHLSSGDVSRRITEVSLHHRLKLPHDSGHRELLEYNSHSGFFENQSLYTFLRADPLQTSQWYATLIQASILVLQINPQFPWTVSYLLLGYENSQKYYYKGFMGQGVSVF